MVVNPTTADMKNITDISFQPFSRKQSDLNYYIAQSLRIYGKTLDTSNEPVSCYIRGLEITDNGNTILIEPGVVFANNSIIILKDQVQLDKPSITSPTYIVIKYEYIEAWEPVIPEIKFVEKINYDKNTEAIFGEFDNTGNLILWDNKKRQEEARNVYGFLSDIYTDQVFVPESTWPLSSKAVHSMLTGIIQNPPMFYGIIENNTLSIVDFNGVKQTESLSNSSITDIVTAFRNIVSNTSNFPNITGFLVNDFCLTFTWSEHRISGIIEGKGETDPTKVNYIELYNEATMGNLSGTHLYGELNRTNEYTELIVYDSSGQISIKDNNSNITIQKLFTRYLASKNVPLNEQKKYFISYWKDTLRIKQFNTLYNRNNEWVVKSITFDLPKFELTDDIIKSNHLSDNLTINLPTLYKPNIIDATLTSTNPRKAPFKFDTYNASLTWCILGNCSIEQSFLINCEMRDLSYPDFSITGNKIDNAILTDCEISGDDVKSGTISHKYVESLIKFRNYEKKVPSHYIDNIDENSFTDDDYMGTSINYPNTYATDWGDINVSPGETIFITLVSEVSAKSLNFDTEIYSFNAVMTDNDVLESWKYIRANNTIVRYFSWTNTHTTSRTIYIRSNSFFEDGTDLSQNLNVAYIVTKSSY